MLRGRASAADAVIPHPDFPGLFLLPAPTELYIQERPGEFAELIAAISREYDYCLIDAPAGIDTGFSTAAEAADRAILVSTPDTPGLMDGGVAARLLRRKGIGDIRLVVNRYNPAAARKKRSKSIDESIDGTGLGLIGIIPEDPEAAAAMNGCIPLLLSKSKKAARAVIDAARRLEDFPVR